MIQENKNLLFQDLCARLPYDVKVDIIYSKDSGSSLRARLCSGGINILNTNILWVFQQSGIYIKPYLFPLSSMTEEQKKEEYEICKEYITGYESNLIDFYNRNYIDYRGLIPKGLAIDATNLNIY